MNAIYVLAYSYLRFSSPAQADGDSIRRQTAAATAWCKRNNVALDETTAMEDRGTSAYRGKHREQGGALGAFLSAITAGRIAPGSVLIVENLDRLSRENPWDAVPLLCSIVNAGVTVVTLSPSEVTYQRGRDLTPLVLAVIEFGRGHGESAIKSERVSAAWEEKKRVARERCVPITRTVPGWIEVRGDKFALIAERAAAVRRMFSLACHGYGLQGIMATLVKEGVPSWGACGHWDRSYVHKILSSRLALGEYQPGRGGKAEGEPIPGYYPAVIDEATWQRTRAAMTKRKHSGRTGKKIPSLFTGLLYDGRGGSRMYISRSKNGRKVLAPSDALEGRGRYISFPYDAFEECVLSCLREIDPADVLGEDAGESVTLTGELAALDHRIGLVEQELAGDGDVPTLAKVARQLGEKRRDLAIRLATAQQKEAGTQSAVWRETKSSLRRLADNEDSRVKLRGLLQQVVERITLVIVPRDRLVRLAAVQVDFTSGARRSLLIRYRPAGSTRRRLCDAHTAFWEARQGAWPRGDDLRGKTNVERLVKRLERYDLLTWNCLRDQH